jgi:3-dehydroquinate synthase
MSRKSQILRVELSERSYDIAIGDGNLGVLGAFVRKRGKPTHAVVLTDDNVRPLWAMPAAESLAAEGIRVDVISVAPGEPSKSIDQAAGLWEGLLELKTDRKSVVVAVGGGVVGDLAGFVAATFARGLRFFQVPTTLLAQVDSSVGGKVGINLPEAKNMVGAFYQPAGVLIDTATLATLPENEYRAGLAEVVKYGIILDADFFAFCEKHVEQINAKDPKTLAVVVTRCCRLKAEIVRQDEREETGLRAVLNYGHTYAHAFESLLGYGKILHGEAVSIGMMCAARLAARLGRIAENFVARQEKLFKALNLPTTTPKLPPKKILAAMQSDKKVQHGRLRFVLPDAMGHVDLVENIDPADVIAALKP